MKRKKPNFFAIYKDFNNGEIVYVDVLEPVFEDILNRNGTICKSRFYDRDKSYMDYEIQKYVKVPITTKEQLYKYIDTILMYNYWSKCEYEVIVCDWPYRDDGLIASARPKKIDVYDQVRPNLLLITDIVWNYIESKINE